MTSSTISIPFCFLLLVSTLEGLRIGRHSPRGNFLAPWAWLKYYSLQRLNIYVAVCSLVSTTTDSAAHAVHARYFCIIPYDHKDRLRLWKALVGCSVQIFDLSNTAPSAAWQRELSGVGSCLHVRLAKATRTG